VDPALAKDLETEIGQALDEPGVADHIHIDLQ
jgi:hypothetical protein